MVRRLHHPTQEGAKVAKKPQETSLNWLTHDPETTSSRPMIKTDCTSKRSPKMIRIRKHKPNATTEFAQCRNQIEILMASLQAEVDQLNATSQPSWDQVGTARELLSRLSDAVSFLRGGEIDDVLSDRERGLPEVGDVIELPAYRFAGMVVKVKDLDDERMCVHLQEPDKETGRDRCFRLGHGEFLPA